VPYRVGVESDRSETKTKIDTPIHLINYIFVQRGTAGEIVVDNAVFPAFRYLYPF